MVPELFSIVCFLFSVICVNQWHQDHLCDLFCLSYKVMDHVLSRMFIRDSFSVLRFFCSDPLPRLALRFKQTSCFCRTLINRHLNLLLCSWTSDDDDDDDVLLRSEWTHVSLFLLHVCSAFLPSGDRVQPVPVSGLAGCPDSQEQTGPQLGAAEHGELGGALSAGPQLPASPHM